jgi:hypothetical protein
VRVSMIRVYAGFDPREEVGYHAFCSSIINRATEPLAITPLHLDTMRTFYFDGHRDGSNAFIYSRFLVPWMECYTGWALFVDGADMICMGDISELWDMRKEQYAVMVAKHTYATKFPRKYIGTKMEADNVDYPRKNWSSVMLINCGHHSWRSITPDGLMTFSGAELHQFEFLPQSMIGEIPKEWNWLADEYGENPKAKLLHWTTGIPAWPAYAGAPHADDWAAAAVKVTHATD